MIPLTINEIREATGARLTGGASPERLASVRIDGAVTTDSRECVPGSLYVARVGEHADGHTYAAPAVERGALAVLGSRELELTDADGQPVPVLVTDDVQTAFGRVGRLVADRAVAGGATIVGITGSSGKTSTKDLLAGVLGRAGATVAPVNSLNGEIGVPLTVCRMTPETRFLVAEMGARGIGHITYLTQIAPPRIAIVLNVGSAHLGEFGSVENIATAKSELVQALPAAADGGVAILNADDPLVAAMAARTSARVVTVGVREQADVMARDVELDAMGRARFTLVTPQGEAAVALPLHGAHHVGNALAVAVAALECGMSLEDVAAALGERHDASRWRMEVTERPDGVVVINDGYNANPDSMRAALDALAAMRGEGRTIAALGGMLELGPDSDSAHRAVAERAKELGIDELVVVGDVARPMLEGFAGATAATDVDAAYELIAPTLRRGDVVLTKSSRDSGLRWLGDRLAGIPVSEDGSR